MAFVIPSKHIYNKDNDKLRDNKIDRIEVGAFEVLPNNEYNAPVYNEKIIVEDYSTNSKSDTKSKVNSFYRDSWTLSYGVGVAKTQITRMYFSGVIKIPKLKNNTLIEEILSKLDSEGNARIKYSARCTKKTGNVLKTETLTETIYNPDSQAIRIDVSVSNGIIENSNRTFTSEKTGESLPNTKNYQPPDTISFTKKYIVENIEDSVTSAITYSDDRTNLGSLEVSYNKESDEYEFSYVLLCGIGFDKLGATKNENFSVGSASNTVTKTESIVLSGETEFYFPDQVEITVYGNTIGIDLQDKTIYVPNQSGNKPFFVEGNELMQTNYLVDVPFNVSNLLVKTGSSSGGTKRVWIELANGVATNNKIKIKANIVTEGGTTPESEEFVIYKNNFKSGEKGITVYDTVEIISATIEDTQISESFLKTLSNYSQGKETATIRCAIADYINYISATVVEYIKYDEENRVWCVLDVKTSYLAEKILQAENLKIHDIECIVVDAEDTKIYINFYSLSIVPYLEKGTLTIPLKEISTTNNVGKMAFDIYDEVIPMVYTANQTDKPMSRYKDGSAKTFVVLGTKIYFDGAVWQELTLQEK